jgi:hypothetical protein
MWRQSMRQRDLTGGVGVASRFDPGSRFACVFFIRPFAMTSLKPPAHSLGGDRFGGTASAAKF